MADLRLEIAVAGLQRLVDAASLKIVSPPMIGAHQTVFPHLTILQRREPMRAANAQQSRPSFAVAEHHQVFREHSNSDGNISEISRQTDRVPIPAQHLAASSSRS